MLLDIDIDAMPISEKSKSQMKMHKLITEFTIAPTICGQALLKMEMDEYLKKYYE